MQFLLWIQTASLVIAMPLLASSPSVDIEEDYEDTKTVFVIFSDLKISSEHGFEVRGDFSSIDDSQDSSFGINVRSIGIANTDLEERLWSFQVPSKSSSSVFRVFHRDGAWFLLHQCVDDLILVIAAEIRQPLMQSLYR